MASRISTNNPRWLILQVTLLMLVCEVVSSDLPMLNISQAQSPVEGPVLDPQPVVPLLAPSPLMPFIPVGVPNLTGKCPLNFSNAESVLTTTAIDCWDSLAPYLANAVCCPQLDAVIKILIGQSSFSSGTLAVSEAHAKDCLSDIVQILEAQGSNSHLLEICSIYPSNLTQATCPMVDVTEIENTINIPKTIESCEKIDPVKECHHKVCESAIMDAAVEIASKNYSMPDMVDGLLSLERLAMIDDCKKIVIRWLASKLNTSDASKVLRGISSCTINKGTFFLTLSFSRFDPVCPLVFPDTKNVSKECGNTISNQTTCCNAMESYMTQLQDQSFVTNLQAFNCAYSLASTLQKANVSANVLLLRSDVIHHGPATCYTTVGSQAPWPNSKAYSPAASSNMNLPALPEAASDHSGLQSNVFVLPLLVFNLFI
ncbi:uncharacterized GPI-anchored protein-like protein [Tanacetum coccineum]|uniref:Uncharacterized GPI-anchored protein-like protein n=1 Tax=Tanacetum coccineum TaxID=301880 RepID=A0ABQ5IDM3_9ASTR